MTVTGQHALHVAVVNQNLSLVKELLHRGADANKPRAVGYFFRPGSVHSQVYWGEHVIAFAACTGQKDMVTLLLKKGADLCSRDTQVSRPKRPAAGYREVFAY